MGRISIWRGTTTGTSYPPLDGHIEVDVAIVGGGITGLTLAMLLADAGKSVGLVEAREIGLGATGNSTGNLYAVVSGQLYRIGDSWDREVMTAVAMSRREAVDQMERIADRLGPGCGFARRAMHFYATDTGHMESVEREYRAAQGVGLAARLADDAPTPLRSVRTLVIDGQAQLHPLAYVQALARHAASDRCRIYEHSPAIAIDEDARRVETAHGRLQAREIVLATHTPKGRFLVQAELLPRREYGLGLRLARALRPQGIFWSVGETSHSIRSLHAGTQDWLIVIGEEHGTGQHDAAAALQRLEAFARSHFDVAAVDFRWSAQNYSPADGLPYIGRSHASEIFVATGFATDGLTYGTLAATVIADEILGRPNRWREMYRASRIAPVKAAQGVLEENLNVARSLLRDYGRAPQASITAIPPGEGAIVEAGGERLAVYRDPDGALSALSPVCTHLKCIVHWNGVERTWDCPCHGSRFDLDGQVVEGPALVPLARARLPE